jgi:hypothetical protein
VVFCRLELDNCMYLYMACTKESPMLSSCQCYVVNSMSIMNVLYVSHQLFYYRYYGCLFCKLCVLLFDVLCNTGVT